jgi:acyl-CoA synthetase (AMP-forming)/AMP-acid ligase II
MGEAEDSGRLSDALRTAGHRVRRLGEIGALDPRKAVAGLRSLAYLVGRGPNLGITAQIHAETRGGERAVVDRHGSLTWSELDRRVDRLCAALREHGLRAGDQVATVLRNGRELTECFIATQKLGLVAAPLNTWSQREELGPLLERSAPDVLLYDTRHTSAIDGAVPDGTHLIAVAGGPDGRELPGSEAYETVLAGHPPARPRPFDGERGTARFVIHTSGTTGLPKAASRDTSTQGSALVGFLDVLPYREGDVIYCPAPMFHAFGLLTCSISVLIGATLVLPDRFDPADSLRGISEHAATGASFVPVMIRRILDLPDEERERHDLSSLRIVLTSGSAMPPPLREAATDLFGPVLHDLYGSTEAGWVAIATPEDVADAPDSVGRPVPGVDLVILGEDDEPLPQGETGRVCVESDFRFEGYASGEEVDERAGYLDTGDLGRIGDDGRLYIVGRADDMVIVGGENVYPIEVETVIDRVDGVEEVAVLGAADDELGEVLVAFVVGDVTEDDVRDRCEDALASFKVPRRIEIVDELPRTSTGKVLRRDLRDQLDG